jgi:hypothetical protein
MDNLIKLAAKSRVVTSDFDYHLLRLVDVLITIPRKGANLWIALTRIARVSPTPA